MIYVGIDVAKDKHDCFIQYPKVITTEILQSNSVMLQEILSAAICPLKLLNLNTLSNSSEN